MNGGDSLYDLVAGFLNDQFADTPDLDQLTCNLANGSPEACDILANMLVSAGVLPSDLPDEQLSELLDQYAHPGDAQAHLANPGNFCPADDVAFCGAYSVEEIAKLESDVCTCEAAVKSLQNEVPHHERLVSLADTPNGHASGDYENEADRLDEKRSHLERAISALREARTRLKPQPRQARPTVAGRRSPGRSPTPFRACPGSSAGKGPPGARLRPGSSPGAAGSAIASGCSPGQPGRCRPPAPPRRSPA